nr:hypothetical protein [Tanacetum cinerariifolium]
MEARILKNGGITSNGVETNRVNAAAFGLTPGALNLFAGENGVSLNPCSTIKHDGSLNAYAAGSMLTETSNVVNASVNRGTNAKAVAGGTSATVGDMISQPMIVNKSSFAAVVGTQPVHKVVNLSELRNE